MIRCNKHEAAGGSLALGCIAQVRAMTSCTNW